MTIGLLRFFIKKPQKNLKLSLEVFVLKAGRETPLFGTFYNFNKSTVKRTKTFITQL
jgi:hypothetical protein